MHPFRKGREQFTRQHFSAGIAFRSDATSHGLARKQKGFTLIEILLVLGIISLLAFIVINAINPSKQMGKARNTQRKADVLTIINAVYQYAIDHAGSVPLAIDTVPKEICGTGTGVEDKTNCDDVAGTGGTPYNNSLSLWLLSGTYLVNIPKDPSALATGTGTRYMIMKSSNNDGRITVYAPDAEGNETISVSR